jgi:dihydroxy-acid dehydratase
MTVTGKTLAENLAAVPTLEQTRPSGHRLSGQKPDRAPNHHISVLKGNRAGAVC